VKNILPALQTALKAIAAHVSDWLEAYFWIPASIIGVVLALIFARYLQHGHPIQETASWIYDLATRLVLCVLVIVLVSVTRQATGIWLTREEQKQNFWLAVLQALKSCFFAALFAYLLSH
jgi:hypothetical protein